MSWYRNALFLFKGIPGAQGMKGDQGPPGQVTSKSILKSHIIFPDERGSLLVQRQA